jgi:anti-sigma regulatory factor (Ser/Thr protein kinase)
MNTQLDQLETTARPGHRHGCKVSSEVVDGVLPPFAVVARVRLDDAGVVIEANEAAGELLGCRVRDLVGKPFVVFLGGPLRRPWFVALREVRRQGRTLNLHGELVSRDPLVVHASIRLAPRSGQVEVTIADVECGVDTDRLVVRLRHVRERQRELAGTLDAVTRPRRVTLPDLDVGAEPPSAGDADATTPAVHDYRLLPSGELFMLVVAGHGRLPLHREVVQSIREVVRALVLAGNPPEELFTQVERICGLRAAGQLASAVAAYGSPDGSRALVVSAGGPAPLVRRVDGTVERLRSQGLPLGEHGRASHAPATVSLGRGDALVLRVDVDERWRDSSAPAGFERRLASVDPQQLGGAATARQLLDPQADHGTSAVLCAVRGTSSSDPAAFGEQVRVRLGKDEMQDVARSRRELSSWLERRAVRTETIERALIVVSELVTNAVVAASAAAELRMSVSRGAVLLEVIDDGGSWHPESGLAPASAGGHGLRVASSLCEDLHVASSAAGTVIRARVGATSMR